MFLAHINFLCSRQQEEYEKVTDYPGKIYNKNDMRRSQTTLAKLATEVISHTLTHTELSHTAPYSTYTATDIDKSSQC